jgi:hypothetical protein
MGARSGCYGKARPLGVWGGGLWGVLVGCALVGCALVGVKPAHAQEEKIGARGVLLGGGISVPIPWPVAMGTYLHGEVGRDFRLDPMFGPGYYPYLQDRTLVAFDGSLNTHLRIGFVRDGIEVTFDFFQFNWAEAAVTHVSNTRLDVVKNNFDDTSAVYIPVDSEEATTIRNQMGEEGLRKDLTDLNLVPLRIYHLGGGLRHDFLSGDEWAVWVPWSAGLALTTLSEAPGALDFGLALSAGAGASYDISKTITFELTLRYWFLVTTAPGEFQTNANHARAVDDSILSALFEVFHFADLNFGLRLNVF